MPLLILAVPFLDTGFVVAKRLKYRRKPWTADANHFHHRMARIGFSQRKTVAYLYGWTLMLAGVAVALRFIPYSDHARPPTSSVGPRDGRNPAGRAGRKRIPVYVLEIFKFKSIRTIQLRKVDPEASEQEIEETVHSGSRDRRVRRDEVTTTASMRTTAGEDDGAGEGEGVDQD